MITPQQGQQQFDAADLLEADVEKGRWRGMVLDKLMLVECEQGIMLEAELDRYIKGLRLIGTPDMDEAGHYQLQLLREQGLQPAERSRLLALAPGFSPVVDAEMIAECLVENDQIYSTCAALFDNLFPAKPAKK